MTICIYLDVGVCHFSLQLLIKAFEEEGYSPVLVDALFLRNHAWEKDTELLVIPGGRDIPYCQALGKAGMRRIRDYVEKGGNYLGICAGAYFGCRQFVFEKDSPLEIIATRDLGFFQGVAQGPVYGTHEYDYDSCRGARLALMQLGEENRRVPIYFNGGCLFENAESDESVEVIACYADLSDQPAAVILCQVGKGKALLSGVHPEYHGSWIKTEDPFLQKLLPPLKAAEKERRAVFRHLLDLLRIRKYANKAQSGRIKISKDFLPKPQNSVEKH